MTRGIIQKLALSSHSKLHPGMQKYKNICNQVNDFVRITYIWLLDNHKSHAAPQLISRFELLRQYGM